MSNKKQNNESPISHHYSTFYPGNAISTYILPKGFTFEFQRYSAKYKSATGEEIKEDKFPIPEETERVFFEVFPQNIGFGNVYFRKKNGESAGQIQEYTTIEINEVENKFLTKMASTISATKKKSLERMLVSA